MLPERLLVITVTLVLTMRNKVDSCVTHVGGTDVLALIGKRVLQRLNPIPLGTETDTAEAKECCTFHACRVAQPSRKWRRTRRSDGYLRGCAGDR